VAANSKFNVQATDATPSATFSMKRVKDLKELSHKLNERMLDAARSVKCEWQH